MKQNPQKAVLTPEQKEKIQASLAKVRAAARELSKQNRPKAETMRRQITI